MEQPPIAVKVKFMGDLLALIEQRNLSMTLPQGSTVGDLLALLNESYGEPFYSRVFVRPDTLHHYMLIFVDGQNINDIGGLAATLGESKVEIIMLPMFEGG